MRTQRIAAFFVTVATASLILSCGAFATQNKPIPGDGPALSAEEEAARVKAKEQAMTLPAPAPVTFETVRQDIITCVRSAEPQARLRCYDAIATKLNIAQTQWQKDEQAKIANFGFWEIVDKKNELDQNVIFLKLPSENLVKDGYGNTRNPTFNIKCVNRKTDAYLDWQGLINRRPNEKKFYIEYFIGNSPDPFVEGWDLSHDQYAVFSSDPVSFVRKLKGQEKLVLRLTPTGEPQTSLAFDMRGFDNALEILVKRCYAS